MKDAKLGHTSHANKSDWQRRIYGRTIRAFLAHDVLRGNADALTQFLARSLQIPCSLATYEELKRIATKKPHELQNSEWLTLHFSDSGKQIEVQIPNFTLGLPKESISAFRQFMREEVRLEAGVLKHATNTLKNDILPALEAVLHEHWPPILISVAGGRFHTAQPRYIDLHAIAMPTTKGKRKKRTRKDDIIARFISQISNLQSRKSKRNFTAKFFRQYRRSEDLRTQIYAYGILKIISKKDRAPATTIRYMNGLRIALAGLAHGIRIRDKVSNYAQRRITGRFERLSAPEKDQIKSLTDPPEEKENENKNIPLVPPSLIELQYIYKPGSPPFLETLSTRAKYILKAILFQSGRRATCLRNLTLSDFLELDEDFHIIIDKSKTSASGQNRLPVGWTWPSSEIEHLRDFLVATRAQCAPNTLLLTLAGIEKADTLKPNQVHSKIFQLLGRIPTHVPRKLFATWWPVRVLCSRNPHLLSHPLMNEVKRHPWFSKDSLRRLEIGLESDLVDAMEIGARILGHSSTYELLDTYCQSWPLLITLVGSEFNLIPRMSTQLDDV